MLYYVSYIRYKWFRMHSYAPRQKYVPFFAENFAEKILTCVKTLAKQKVLRRSLGAMVYEFMILLITVTLLGSIVVTNSVNEDADSENHHARDVKEHWRLVFGSKADIFASSVTLNLAIDDVSAGAERLADKIDPSQRERVERYVNVMGGQEHISYARQLGCLSYDVGLELLRNQTADGVPPSLRAVPFVVNKARNAICVHFTKVPSEFKKSFLFHYSIPIALTIDKQLYSVVDNMFFKNDTLQQAMGASPEKRTIFLVVYPYRYEYNILFND